MSDETMDWLNSNTLIGFTEKRGNAWHYRQGADNHYPDAIPVEDVLARLFPWNPVEKPLAYSFEVDGKNKRFETDRKLIIRSDNGALLGIFKDGYQPHPYPEWLVENVSTILGDSLAVGSAGLLKGGAQAWVSVEIPENISSDIGVEFRPNLLACTSFDGSIATTYKRVVTLVVCDNTLQMARSEKGQDYKLKHTKYSQAKISDARDALAIVYEMADEFSAELERLTQWEVSDKAFEKVLNTLVPIPKDESNKRGVTVAEKKRDSVAALYRNDSRANQWNGTAFGVLQAFNTWTHHEAQVRKNAPRVIRNMENVVKDKMAEHDSAVLAAIAKAAKPPVAA